jgi:DNA polymerase-3 subunit delta'
MDNFVFHPKTERDLKAFLNDPVHAVLLSAPTGGGKGTVARYIASELLQVAAANTENYPYIKLVQPVVGKAIGIEAIRDLEHFLSLKVPGKKAIDRVVIIEDSQLLTTEAQNALLKTLEEPPESTVLVLTTNHQESLLPTVKSRLQLFSILRPLKPPLRVYFAKLGFSDTMFDQVYAVSGGLPGLMHALLTESDHPLRFATDYARRILQSSAYERLVLVEEISKKRQLAQDICFILQHMAHLSLQASNPPAAKRWQNILSVSYDAADALALHAQPKLVLTNLMLNLT